MDLNKELNTLSKKTVDILNELDDCESYITSHKFKLLKSKIEQLALFFYKNNDIDKHFSLKNVDLSSTNKLYSSTNESNSSLKHKETVANEYVECDYSNNHEYIKALDHANPDQDFNILVDITSKLSKNEKIAVALIQNPLKTEYQQIRNLYNDKYKNHNCKFLDLLQHAAINKAIRLVCTKDASKCRHYFIMKY
jgi:hypothetical protein